MCSPGSGGWVALPRRGHRVERVKFDLQRMERPEISGVAYQQGTLLGYEVREYLLEKWGRACSYCGITGVPLQVEHHPGESQRGHGSRQQSLPGLRALQSGQRNPGYPRVSGGHRIGWHACWPRPRRRSRMRRRSTATRLALSDRLKQEGYPLESGSGGLTKYNRTERGLPKAHWIDAACVVAPLHAAEVCQRNGEN